MEQITLEELKNRYLANKQPIYQVDLSRFTIEKEVQHEDYNTSDET